jgi:hypothetical protein
MSTAECISKCERVYNILWCVFLCICMYIQTANYVVLSVTIKKIVYKSLVIKEQRTN